MTTRASALFAAVQELTQEERDDLVQSLLDEDDVNGMDETEFEAELHRRAEEAQRDPSVLIPWEQVKSELLNDD